MNEPKLEELKSLFDTLRTNMWATSHRLQRSDMDFYNGEFSSLLGKLPKALRRWKIPPTHRYIIDDAVDNIDPIHARIILEERIPKGRAKAKVLQEEQELGNQFWTHMWGRLNHTTRTAPSWDFVKHLVAAGLSAMKVVPTEVYDLVELEQREGESKSLYEARSASWAVRHKGKPKVGVQSIAGSQLVFDYYCDEPQFVFEFYERDRSQLKLDYPWVDLITKTKSKTALWVEYWSPTSYGFFADWKPVLTAEHGANDQGLAPNPYGFIPYSIKYSGYGTRDANGRPEFEAVGLIRFIRDSLASEARLRTQLDWMREEYAWGMLHVKHPDEQTAELWASRLTREPGTAVSSDDKLVVMPLVTPNIPRELFTEEEMIRRDIQSATFVKLVPSPRGESGASRSLALQETKIKLEPPLEATRQAIKEVCWMVAQMQADYIGEPLTIRASTTDGKSQMREITPELMYRFSDVSIEIEPRSEDEKARHQQRMEQLYNDGAISRERLAEESGIDDYHIERERREEEDVSSDPVVLEPIKQYIVQKLSEKLLPPAVATGVAPTGAPEVQPAPQANVPAVIEPPQKPMPGSVEEMNNMLAEQQRVAGLPQAPNPLVSG